MRLLLTGGTGFFGLALLRHWHAVAVPPEVVVLSRDPARFQARYPSLAQALWLSWVQGDPTDASALAGIAGGFSHVLHAATDSTLGPQRTPQQRFDQIVDGTRRMLDFARERGASRFLLTSSGGVYGRLPAGMTAVPEDYLGMPDPLDPKQAYSVAKRMAEHLCALAAAPGFEVVIARCFAFVGRDLPLDVHFAIGNFIRDALYGPAITVQGDGTPLRSYMDQRDLAEWLLALLERGVSREAYNLGSGEAISVAQLAHRVRDLLAPGKAVRVLGQPSSGPRSVYVPDVRKAAQSLGLGLRIGLDQAIIDTAHHASTDTASRPRL
jgi:UDP-glucuronate decarboxylase